MKNTSCQPEKVTNKGMVMELENVKNMEGSGIGDSKHAVEMTATAPKEATQRQLRFKVQRLTPDEIERTSLLEMQ